MIMKPGYSLTIIAVGFALLALVGLSADAVATSSVSTPVSEVQSSKFKVQGLPSEVRGPQFDPQTAGDWPMYGHDVSRTNYNPDETLINAGNVNQLIQRWQANIFNRPTPPSGAPSVANGKVFVGSSRSSGNNFFAFDAVTGQQAWNVNVGYGVYGCLDVGIGSTSAISGTIVSVGGGDQAYYGLDTESGAQIWRNPMNLGSSAYAWESPLMAHGRSYLGMASNCDNPSVRGEVRAVDYVSGTPVASQYFVPEGQRGAGIWNSPALSPDGSTMVVTTGEDYGGYNGTYNRAIVSLDPITLEILQSNRQGNTGGDVDFATSPLIFSDSQGRVLTGAVHKNSNFYAYVLNDINSGPIWSKPMSYSAGMMPAYDPSYGNGGTLFIAGSSRLYAVDPATGVERWPSILQSGLHGNMAIANGLIFLNTGSGGLRILDETNGAVLRTIVPANPGSTYSGVAVSNGFIYWLSGSYLNAWSLPAGSTATPTTQATSTNTALPTTSTSTSVPSATPTTGEPCGVVPQGGLTSCSGTTYDYDFIFYIEPGCQSSLTGTGTFQFEVSQSQFGPWTLFNTQTRPVTFPPGPRTYTLSGSLVVTNIPTQYSWYRILFSAPLTGGVNAYGETLGSHICGEPTPTPTAPCPLDWRIVSSQNTSNSSMLTGIATIQWNDVWAVGKSGNNTFMERWNGTQWALSLPTPVAGFIQRLNDVSALSSSEVWAVGWYEGSGMGTLVERWNGTQWSVVSSPNGSGFYNELLAVSARASDDVWAVGYQTTSGNVQHTLTLHWNGTAWSVVPSPDGPGSNTYLYGVASIASNDAWAVGKSSTGSEDRAFILHWDGTAWSMVSNPASSQFSALNDVVAVASNDVWAVGYQPGVSPSVQALVMHWDGAQWSIASTPVVGGGSTLLGVDAMTSSDVWAVGTYSSGGPVLTLTMHWNGSQWSVVPSPNGQTASRLSDVSILAPNDVWAVGYSDISQGTEALTERYSYAGCATTTPTPTASATSTATRTATTAIATSTSTSTVTPSATIGPPCGVIPSAQGNTSCTAPSTYDYAFSFYVESGCTTSSTGTATIEFEVAPDASGPWTLYDTQYRAVSFPQGPAYVGIEGSLTEAGIPGQYTVYRITFYAALSNGTNANGQTPATAICDTTCTLQFTDVPPDHTFYPFVRCLVCRGIVSGYSDGTFRPGEAITRGQISKVVSNAAGFDDDPGPQIYEDVDAANPFYVWVNRLSMRGFMGGYPCGTVPEEPCISPDDRPYFRPGANASRGQLSKIVANAAGFNEPATGYFYADVPEEHPFYVWIMRLSNHQVLSGYPCGGEGELCDDINRPYFRPYNEVTRGQASKIVANAFYPNCETPGR
jgi:outer membrane protein assembly factor BamB